MRDIVSKPLQHPLEIATFAELLRSEGVKSYLEIGSKYGGSLKVVADALPIGSRVVSVDINVNGPHLANRIKELRGDGYDAHLIVGNSTHDTTIAEADALGPYDAVFIDADHKPPAVWSDWKHYGPMARIVAFHDIAWKRNPDWPGPWIRVPGIWNEIKQGYRFQEIKLCETGINAGIGVLWRS